MASATTLKCTTFGGRIEVEAEEFAVRVSRFHATINVQVDCAQTQLNARQAPPLRSAVSSPLSAPLPATIAPSASATPPIN